MSNHNQKYRPYFTASELQEVILALKSSPSPSRMPLIRYLEGFALKISLGIISSAHTLEPSLEDRLELKTSHTEAINSLQSKRFNAYRKWRDFPEKCTPEEIEQAMMYRYENNMMNTTEEITFERDQLSILVKGNNK